jgi:hypothetical protein
MKPKKNHFYCRQIGRKKMLFETKKKAETFIRFNAEEIEAESGYSPCRAYYCEYCAGWHTTSNPPKN